MFGKGMGDVMANMVITPLQRRRLHTEEKAKGVAAAWGTEIMQFLAALFFLHGRF